MATKVLISGAGIAGCCLGWWLDKHGYAVTIVEQAPEPRRGGYVIDFWGLGYEVAERMGVLADLKRQDLSIDEFRVVDQNSRRIAHIDQQAMQNLTGGRLMSLPRSAVALTLYEAIKDGVDVRFGETVADLRQTPDHVEVRFQSGGSDTFDLVFGADGLHSAVRALSFGPEAQFERFLGYYAAAFTASSYPHRNPHVYIAYGLPGREIWRITLDDESSVFLLIFADARRLEIPAHAADAQRAMLTDLFRDAGWEAGDILGALNSATDLYFDRMSQTVMPHWSNGRVALLGDACACPSLLAGEGSSMAMAEAYTLAGELHAAGGDHVRAFAAYEQRLKPYVARKQKGAVSFAASFVPKSALGRSLRNLTLNLVSQFGLTRLLFRAQMQDVIELGNY